MNKCMSISGYNKERQSVFREPLTTFEDAFERVLNFRTNGLREQAQEKGACFLTLTEGFFTPYVEFSIDDVILEFNLDVLRSSLHADEVLSVLEKKYPTSNVRVLADLKNNLEPFVLNHFTHSYRESVQNYPLDLEWLVVSGERYDTSCSFIQDGHDLFIRVLNVAPECIALCSIPPYGNKYGKYNFRPISAITDYAFLLTNKGKDNIHTNPLSVVSYSLHRQNLLTSAGATTFVCN